MHYSLSWSGGKDSTASIILAHEHQEPVSYTHLDVYKRQGKAWSDCYHGEGKEWHRTKEAALVRAEKMRQKKIASLKKQIEKLERMKFE